MAQHKKNKASKSEAKIETVYMCPICGETHDKGCICPRVNRTLSNVKAENQSFIMGGIFLECIRQEKDFFDILKEVAYILSGYNYNIAGAVIRYFSTDFLITYFATALGCQARSFCISQKKAAEDYYKILNASKIGDEVSISWNDDEDIEEISMALEDFYTLEDESSDLVMGLWNCPKVEIVKTFSNSLPIYSVRLDIRDVKDINSFDKNQIWGQSVDTDLCFRNISLKSTTIEWSSVFYLYSERKGELRDLFERKLEWVEVAKDKECQRPVMEAWCEKLEAATKKGYLIWNIFHRNSKSYYSTSFGKSEIEFYVLHQLRQKRNVGPSLYAPQGDCIFIKEKDNKMYYFGYLNERFRFSDTKNNGQDAEIIHEIRELRSLAEIIESWKEAETDGTLLNREPKKVIKKDDVLAVTYSFVCSHKGHYVMPYCGIVTILTPEGEKIEEKVYLGKCGECGVYYIFRRDYDMMSKKGVLLCTVKDDETGKIVSNAPMMLNPKSVLSKAGYNVQATDNLSSKERKETLRRVIEEKLASPNDILNLLELQIHLHSESEKHQNAVAKWKEDAEFVKEYGINSGRTEKISKITL